MIIARFVWNWLLNALTMGIIMVLITRIHFATPSLSVRDQIRIILLAGLILGLINVIVKPILKLLSLPLIILTAGLFLIVINIFVLMLVTWLVPEIVIPDVMSYVLAAILLGILNTIENLFFV